MNKKKLLLIAFLIGLPQAYGSESAQKKNELAEGGIGGGGLKQKKNEIIEAEEFFPPSSENIEVLGKLEEKQLKRSVINLGKLEEFFKKKKGGRLTAEDFAGQEDLIFRQAIFHSIFKTLNFTKIEQQLLAERKSKEGFMSKNKNLVRENKEKENKIRELEEKIKGLSGLQTPLAQAENHCEFVLKSLKSLDGEDANFGLNQERLKDYLLSLGYEESNKDLEKILQKNSERGEENIITLDARIQLFNTLDHEAAQIRTNLVFTDFARRLTTLLQSKQFAPVAVPSFHEISSDPNATLKWQENTKKLIDFIIADWQSIKNKEINFKNSDNLHLLLGMGDQKLGQIETLIYPLKNMALAEFSARIDSPKKRVELLMLLEEVAGYLDWLKTEFGKREKQVNHHFYGKNENSKFTQDYNKKASIKTMHDYLDGVLASSKKYTKAIDFIFQKIGRLTSQQCIDGTNSYIEEVKPVREIGGLLSVIGLLNMGLSLRGHTLNGMKQSGLELGVYLKNKELKSAAKYIGASLNKKHLFGLILPVGIGVAFYGHYKTDTLREKRDSFKAVITELENPYQRQHVEGAA